MYNNLDFIPLFIYLNYFISLVPVTIHVYFNIEWLMGSRHDEVIFTSISSIFWHLKQVQNVGKKNLLRL